MFPIIFFVRIQCNKSWPIKMYFHSVNDSISPCGGISHVQVNQFKQIIINEGSAKRLASIERLTDYHLNGEKAKFTFESVACKGTEF